MYTPPPLRDLDIARKVPKLRDDDAILMRSLSMKRYVTERPLPYAVPRVYF